MRLWLCCWGGCRNTCCPDRNPIVATLSLMNFPGQTVCVLRASQVLVFVNRTDEVEKVVEHLKSSGVAAEGFHRLQGPFRVQRHRRGCQQEFSSIDDENSHQRHPKEVGRSRPPRIYMGTPWHVSRGVKDLAPRLRDACNGIFPSDVNRFALG